MSGFELVGYLCEIVDRYDDERPEPDWAKVPDAKREQVRAKWVAAQSAAPVRWHLYGPQIPWYQRQEKLLVTVIGKCADVCADDCPARPSTALQRGAGLMKQNNPNETEQ